MSRHPDVFSSSTVPFITVHTVANCRPPSHLRRPTDKSQDAVTASIAFPLSRAPVFDCQLPPLAPHVLVSTGRVSRTQKDSPRALAIALALALTVSSRLHITSLGQPTQPALSGKALTLQPKGSQAPLSVSLHLSTPHRDTGRYLPAVLLHARPALACANR